MVHAQRFDAQTATDTAKGLSTYLVLLLLCMPAVCAKRAMYCAFEVNVKRPTGSAYPGVPGALVRDGQQIADFITDKNGQARICDTPLDYLNFVVGFDLCGSVEIRRIKPLWLQTQHLWFTYEPGPGCRHFPPFSTACHVLLRVEDNQGHPLSGARLEGKKINRGQESTVSDRIGVFSSPLSLIAHWKAPS